MRVRGMQYDDLVSLLPSLCPRIQPRTLLDSDLATMLASAPADAQHDLQQALRQWEGAASECSVCGARRARASVAPGGQSSDAAQDASARHDGQNGAAADLALTSVWKLNFRDRLCELQAPAACCRTCRACFDIGGVLQLSATRSSGADGCATPLIA